MKSKKMFILKVICILFFVISIFLICVHTVNRIRLENKIALSEEIKQTINYNQMLEDIRALELGKKVVYAEKQRNQDKNIKIEKEDKKFTSFNYLEVYLGEGYRIEQMSMADAYGYTFYVDDEVIYEVINGAWFDLSDWWGMFCKKIVNWYNYF